MALGTIDRISVTTVVDNSIDALRADDRVARRFGTTARAASRPCARSTGSRITWRSRAGTRPRASRSTSA